MTRSESPAAGQTRWDCRIHGHLCGRRTEDSPLSIIQALTYLAVAVGGLDSSSAPACPCREALLLWAANWMEAYREEHGQQ